MNFGQHGDTESQAGRGTADTVTVVTDVEDIADLATAVEEELSNIDGIIDMEAAFTLVVVGDQESISANQLAAFRAGMQTTMIAANGNLKAVFGIDTEAAYTDPDRAYAKDIEGIKEFFKKIWDKIKVGLIKANAFFRKMFLKFLNMVTFRKGGIEKLKEELAASTSGNETIKASKYSIVKKMAGVAAFNGKLSGTNIAADADMFNEMFANTNGSFLTDLNVVIKKAIDAVKNTSNNADAAVALTESIGDLDKLKDNTALKAIAGVNSDTLKAFKKSEGAIKVRISGGSIYLVGITDKNAIITGVVKVKTDKVKTMSGLDATKLKTMLEAAETANEDFKDVVNSAFEAYDEIETLSELFLDLDIPDEQEIDIKLVEKTCKNLAGKTPWIAFHTAMDVYKSIGYSMDLAKAYLKDEKGD